MAVVLEKLNLIRFGKFKDFEINANDGLNVIYGVNEAGKSTVNLFIKAMLYGMPTRKKVGEALKERERAIPWGEKRAEGVLTVNNNGVLIEIRRCFGKTAAGDKTEVSYLLSGEKIDTIKEESIGEWLFGISREVFEKTLWINQNGSFMGGRDDELIKRVSNLNETGDEVVSAKNALESLVLLSRKIKAADKRNTDGTLDELHKRLEDCRREKYDLSTRLAQQETGRQRKERLMLELAEVEHKIDCLEVDYKKRLEYEKNVSDIERYKQICDCDTKLEKIYQNEEYKRSRDLSEKIVSEVWNMQERILLSEKENRYDFTDNDTVKDDKKRLCFGVVTGVGTAFLIIGTIMAIVCGVLVNSLSIAAAMAFVAVLGIICITYGISNIKRCNTLKNEYLKKKNDEEQRKRKLDSEVAELKYKLSGILNKFGTENTEELKSLYIKGQSFDVQIAGLLAMKKELVDGYDIEKLKSLSENLKIEDGVLSSEEAECKLKELRKIHIGILSELKEIESKMAYDVKEYRIPADIDTEINAIKDEIEECNKKLCAIKIAQEAIEEAAEEWKSMIAPEINEGVNAIMCKLTNGQHNDLRVSDEFKIRVADGNDLEDAEYYSRGTYEQLYFALRAALARGIGDDVPLFLDDILTTYDEDRAKAAFAFLKEFSEVGQVFLFTCHRHIEKIAEAFQAHIIKI